MSLRMLLTHSMTAMKINEIFYSLQGEGRWTGTPAVFVRFSGCNLKCSFCDTAHQEGDEMTEAEILDEVLRYPASHVILTGGEPAQFLTESFVQSLHDAGKKVHIETNGTIDMPDAVIGNIDWITVSPKTKKINIRRVDELKLLYPFDGMSPECFEEVELTDSECRYLQPCDVQDDARNQAILRDVISYIKEHPQWKLSLQTHKMLGIR